jgi:hypothetical protein
VAISPSHVTESAQRSLTSTRRRQADSPPASPPGYPAGNQGTGFNPPPPPSGPGNGGRIAGISLGSLAFVFLPIILGPGEADRGRHRAEAKGSEGPAAIIVSGLGLVISSILSNLVK